MRCWILFLFLVGLGFFYVLSAFASHTAVVSFLQISKLIFFTTIQILVVENAVMLFLFGAGMIPGLAMAFQYLLRATIARFPL